MAWQLWPASVRDPYIVSIWLQAMYKTDFNKSSLDRSIVMTHLVVGLQKSLRLLLRPTTRLLEVYFIKLGHRDSGCWDMQSTKLTQLDRWTAKHLAVIWLGLNWHFPLLEALSQYWQAPWVHPDSSFLRRDRSSPFFFVKIDKDSRQLSHRADSCPNPVSVALLIGYHS